MFIPLFVPLLQVYSLKYYIHHLCPCYKCIFKVYIISSCSLTGPVYQSPHLVNFTLCSHFHLSHGHCKANVIIIIIIIKRVPLRLLEFKSSPEQSRRVRPRELDFPISPPQAPVAAVDVRKTYSRKAADSWTAAEKSTMKLLY